MERSATSQFNLIRCHIIISSLMRASLDAYIHTYIVRDCDRANFHFTAALAQRATSDKVNLRRVPMERIV